MDSTEDGEMEAVEEEEEEDSNDEVRLRRLSNSMLRVLIYAADLETSLGSGNLGALGTLTSVSTYTA